MLLDRSHLLAKLFDPGPLQPSPTPCSLTLGGCWRVRREMLQPGRTTFGTKSSLWMRRNKSCSSTVCNLSIPSQHAVPAKLQVSGCLSRSGTANVTRCALRSMSWEKWQPVLTISVNLSFTTVCCQVHAIAPWRGILVAWERGMTMWLRCSPNRCHLISNRVRTHLP